MIATTSPAPIIDVARESANIATRITTISHPDDAHTAVPVVIETGVSNGVQTTSVGLAEGVLEELDRRLPGPRRRTNVAQLTEVASFIDYVKRYADDRAVIYADTKALSFTAVFDEHPAGASTGVGSATGWREHRARYTCPRSPEWIAWTAKDSAGMKQDEFADFLEARLEDLVAADGYPKPIDVLSVARQLHIKTKGEFRREVNPTNGDNILICKTETDTGSTQIPRAFAIAVPVFEGGERYQVEARIRFALASGVPLFSYQLHRRPEIERDAFTGVRLAIAAGTERLLLAGTP